MKFYRYVNSLLNCFIEAGSLVGAGDVRPGVGRHPGRDHVAQALHEHHAHLIYQMCNGLGLRDPGVPGEEGAELPLGKVLAKFRGDKLKKRV